MCHHDATKWQDVDLDPTRMDRFIYIPFSAQYQKSICSAM